MKSNNKIENIIKESIKSVLKEYNNDEYDDFEYDDEYSYDEYINKINSILNNIARKNGWYYEEDRSYGKFMELGGSQVYFDVEDDGRIYISNIKISGMSNADESKKDCQELAKLLTLFGNSNIIVK